MNFLKRTRRIRKKIHRFGLKVITAIAGITFFCTMAADPEYSDMSVVLIMLVVSGAWLSLIGYANGWMYDTEPYYKRIEKEGDAW